MSRDQYDATTSRCVMTHTREPERPRPARHGLLCVGHYQSLEHELSEIPSRWTASEAALVRGSSSGPKITGTKEPGLNLDDTLVKARTILRDHLAASVVNILETHPDGLHAPEFTVTACSAFLLRWLPWLSGEDWIRDFHVATRDATRQLRNATSPTRTRRVDLGPCDQACACDLTTHLTIACQGVIRATVTDDDQTPTLITCSECGHQLQPEQWRTLSKRLRGGLDPMLTAAQLSQLLRIPVGTLQRWAGEDGWRRDDHHPKRYHSDDAQASYDAHQAKQEAS